MNHRNEETLNEQWLSLSAAARMLGVHPSTVRNWSDRGILPSHRTQGGHRRYLRSEVELCLQAQRTDEPADANLVVQNALRNTRLQISEGTLAAESWYHKLDEEARDQYRSSGRALLQGLINYMVSNDALASAQAETLGYEYATRARRCGLNEVEATHAFLFFRNVLLESMLAVYEAAVVRSPYAWSDMFRKVNRFTDEIMITLLETYEAFQQVNHR